MKKLITWGTPKQIQRSREDTRWHSKIRKPCKITKGEHEFKLIKSEVYSFCHGTMNYHQCACGKKKWEFINE